MHKQNKACWCENIFAKGYVSNWSEKVFVMKKVKNTVLQAYFISELTVKFLESFTQKNCKIQNKDNFKKQ